MTITASSYSPISYAGNAITNAFSITFPFQLDTDIFAFTTVLSSGLVTHLVQGTDYNITPILNSPAATGTLVMAVAPPVGTELTIGRSTPITQLTAWLNNASNPAVAIENAVDKLTNIAQEAKENPFDLGGDASTFLRGDNTLSNTLIGASGTITLPSDTTALFIAKQNASASIKVAGGSTSQTAFSFGVSGSANPWDARIVYDPNTTLIGTQFFGGSIDLTIDSSGNLDTAGQVSATTLAGNLDGSFIASGTINVARLGTGSGNANTFLNGVGAFAIPAGGGGINTTTTGTFVIAAVNSTQTVPVTDATGIVTGTYLQISDGTHTIVGLVTGVASLNLTVKTTTIVLGTAGNTMASGAAVQAGFVGGVNSILITDAATAPASMTTMTLTGDTAGATASVPSVGPNAGGTLIDLYVSSLASGSATVKGYFDSAVSLLQTAVYSTGPQIYDSIGIYPQGGTVVAGSPIHSTVAGQVLNSFSSGFGTALHFSTIGASSITSGSLTPPLLQATNSPSAGQVPSYADSTHFTWTNASTLPTSTDSGQVLLGNATYGNVIDISHNSARASLGLTLAQGTATNNFGSTFWSSSDGTQALWSIQKLSGGNWGVPTGVATNYVIGGGTFDGALLSLAGTASTIDSSALTENIVIPGMARTAMGFRSVYGPLSKIFNVDMTALSAKTLDLINGAYQRLTNFTVGAVLTVQDTTPLPSNGTFRYASELTLEIVAPGSNVTSWAAASGGTITWANGATAPTLSSSGTNIVRFVRRQGLTDWVGYVENPISGSGTVTSVASGSGLTGGPITSSGTLSIATGGVTASMIANNTITNTHIATGAAISPLKLALPGGTTTFLRADGSWAVPPGTGGGGGGPTLAGTQTWTGVNTYTNNNLFNGRNVFTGPQIFNAGAFDGGNATGSVAIMGTYPTDPVAPFQAAGISTNITNNDSVNGGNVLALLVQQTNSSTAATSGTGAACFNVNSQCNNTGGFSIALQERAWYAKINGGVGDGIWLNSWGPSITYQSTPDSNGITHSFGSGFIRIGEVNYGNGWMDFGFIQNPASATQSVSGIWFIPDYLPAGFGGTSANPKFNAQWAIVIGAATSTFSSANVAKHWTGLLIDQDAVDHLGLDINCRGGSTSGNAPGAALNIQNNYVTGINFAGSSGTTNGGTSATFSSTGNAAITMADDQSIKLGSIWLRGHSGALQYSTNGTVWSNVTLP